MWMQDDWNSCEDLLFFETPPPARKSCRSGERKSSRSNGLSSYPVGCAPEYLLKQYKGQNSAEMPKDSPGRLFDDRQKLNKLSCRRSSAPLPLPVNKTSQKQATFKHTSTNSSARQEELCRRSKSLSRHFHRAKLQKAAKNKKSQAWSSAHPLSAKNQLLSFAQSVRHMLSLSSPSAHLKLHKTRVNPEPKFPENASSDGFASSANSTFDLPFVQEEESGSGRHIYSREPALLMKIPISVITFEPFSFEPWEYMEDFSRNIGVDGIPNGDYPRLLSHLGPRNLS